MSILHQILNWTEGLPPWQSDAVARLLAKQALSPDDIEDLFALLKAEHGIPDPKGRTPRKLTADQIPIPETSSILVQLKAIKNMQHVNAIAGNQRLPIAPLGLTVIYGDNGSGKSGYSRVLKRACRARDQMEAIHPNANLPINQTSSAEADFEISVNGIDQEVHWINSQIAPPELSSIAIFDSHCARAYLDNEDDFSFVPYGLDVFERLAKVCTKLKELVEYELKQFSVDLTVFSHLNGDTSTGKLIASLSAKTSPLQIDALTTLSPEELDLHAELDKSLKESNPKDKANQLRLRARRIATIASNAASEGDLVGQIAIKKLRDLADSYRSAKAAAQLAAQLFKEEENLLPGTGGEAWRELFDAARKFALESHPDKTFPTLGIDAQCPLCQQPLGEGAGRLLRFEAFIQNESEKNSQACRSALVNEFNIFKANNLSFNLDEVTYGEIQALDQQLAIDVREYEQKLSERREAVKIAINSNNWEGINSELVNPVARLTALANNLNVEVETLEKASDEKARAALQQQFLELDCRIKLKEVREAVITAVLRLSHQAKLNKCLTVVKTKAISMKASELTEKVVSKELADALNQEFKELGVGSLRVSLQSRADKGKALHKLKLELPQTRRPADILSEGEQRAIAIGSFLAEIRLSGSNAGVVFDDPVSSLDHKRRERVAKRLVSEGKIRQVIIFTHDLYFLNLLSDISQKLSVTIQLHSIRRTPDGFGVSDSDLPFDGMNTKSRVGYLKNQHQSIKKIFISGDELDYRKNTADLYRQLRIAWERAVEEILLRNVVLRFRKGIETQRLSGVLVEDSDYATVDYWMSKCSNYAHDQALLGGTEVPEPDELLNDINALDIWRNKIYERSEKTQKARKTVTIASSIP